MVADGATTKLLQPLPCGYIASQVEQLLQVYVPEYQRWFDQNNSVMAFRNGVGNGFRGDDNQRVGRGNKTVAFTRGWDRFFVIATFHHPEDTVKLRMPS